MVLLKKSFDFKVVDSIFDSACVFNVVSYLRAFESCLGLSRAVEGSC